MANGVMVSVVLNLRPEAVEPFRENLQQMLEDTRRRRGFRSSRLDVSCEDPNKLQLLSQWDSLEDYENYVGWRAARGESYDLVIPISTAPPRREIWRMGSTD